MTNLNKWCYMYITSKLNEFENGFDNSSDIFNRKPLFEQIKRLIINSPDANLVFAIDDVWGSGKTSFVKMLKSEIELNNSEDIDVVYFDAFENDYQSDPFISISAELYSLLKSKGPDAEFVAEKIIQTGKKIGAKILVGSAKIAITALTAGVVNGTVIDKANDVISDSISSEMESFVESKIKSMEDEKKEIIDFKESLEKIYINTKKKTLVIIDELDRARPDYSLDLLEKIKHLFSVKGLVFLLVMNREQFEKGIACRYGDINTSLYLNKFIHYWFTLPKVNLHDLNNDYNQSGTTIYDYVQKLVRMNHSLGISSNGMFSKLLSYLIEVNNCSLREAERCLSAMVVVDNHENIARNRDNFYMAALALVCFLKVTSSGILYKLLRKEGKTQDILDLLNANNQEFQLKPEGKVLKHLLNYHYLDKDNLVRLRSEKGSFVQQIEGDFGWECNHIGDIAKSINNMTIS
ncbi:P-loop NTPase fold protein, partial [Enterobacter hormaechei]